MAPISLKIVIDDGAVTRKVKFNSTDTVQLAHKIVKEKVNVDENRDYALCLPCADNDLSGVWLENHRTLEYYMLRDGDSLDYICKMRNLRVKLLDDTVKTLQVDQSKNVADLIQNICGRFGITNWDEYGLCRDNEESEATKDGKPGQTSTLKPKANPKERDVQLEQLSKKLKTDDNVEWLDQYKTLREMAVGPNETLLLKRRLFYSDRNVDSRDPVQLNLLYVQTRDAILNGTHPVTEDQAVQFAGIQCQIHFGDFQEDKHKPGFIENLNEYLPEQYSSSWGIEKKILKEYKKHKGLSQVEAKYFYTKTARDLPTYGVTFFLVKEQLKGKKKLVPRLLGINAQSILRLDETTKEILQVWPLTHVKTYHTGKKETFTLNFGDYNDKEYCVKTQDAHRIRDILEGYIDIIRKRMLAKHSVDGSEGMVISQEYVEGSRGNIIQHVQNNPSKVVEQSFVGPSKILPFERGDQISQGTQIVTMQQILVSDQTNQAQKVVKGEIPVRSDMSLSCIKSLNQLNTNSVKIVEFLTDPNDTNLRDARRTLEQMQADLPVVVEGIRTAAEKQTSEEAKKKLLDELQELEEYMKTLSDSMDANNFDCTAADDAAKKIADVTTLMYFSLDPRTRRRSDMLRRSRKSFIADERQEASLHRASFLAAANNALHCVANAGNILKEPYLGEPLSQDDAEEAQKAMRSNVASLNAAIALYLQAHADPYCIDYSAALASMNSIRELIPELAKNAQALGSVKSDDERNKFLHEIQDLLDAARKICVITGTEDHEKMQEDSVKYADVASKLIFTLGHGANCSKQDEIIELAKQAGEKTSRLLSTTNELTCQAPDEPAVSEVDKMGVKVAHSARDLLACAHLTAPAIHEPHCRSALNASAEALSSSTRQLASAWKPLVEDPTRQHLAKNLQQRTLDLALALDKLTDSYADIDDEVVFEALPVSEQQRLKFIKSASGARNNLKSAEEELNKPFESAPNQDMNYLEEDLQKKVTQLNAATASLIAATSDRSNPDYVTAELALNTITELMPDIVKESKMVAACKDGAERAAILNNLRALCEATQRMCANSSHLGGEEMNNAVSKLADASGRLVFTFSPHPNPIQGQQIVDLAAEACAKTSQLLTNVQQIAESVGGDLGDELDKRGTKTVDAAQALLRNAELTARTISDPRCEAAFLSSVEALSSSAKDLAESWSAVPSSPRRKELDADLRQLEAILDQLRRFCGEPDLKSSGFEVIKSPQEQKRLRFINTLSGVKNKLKTAEDEFDKPITTHPLNTEDIEAAQRRLSDKMTKLNAAIAALVAANSDRENPDYARAEEAVRIISNLMPDVVRETKLISCNNNEAERAAMMEQMRVMYEAIQNICASASEDENLNESVAKFAEASGKLVFVRSGLVDPVTEKQVLDLSSVACGKASHLLANVHQLAEAVGGETGQELDNKGVKTADATQALLTNARLTAPTISEPQCQAAMMSSIDALSSSGRDLQKSWRKVGDKPYHDLQKSLDKELEDFEAALKELRGACQVKSSGVDKTAPIMPKDQQRLKFINNVSSVKYNLAAAQDELNKPLPVGQMKNEDIESAQRRLADKTAQLNGAIAALVAANSDRDNPDYSKAEEAVKAINILMPHVVKESQIACANKNEKDRAAMLDHIRALCDATQKICASATQDQGLNNSATEFAEASNHLKFIFSATDGKKEKQVEDLSTLACSKASHLLAKVQQLAEAVGGEQGQELDRKGAKTVDAAQVLLTNARLTAPTISEPQCQAAMMSSIDALSSTSQDLKDSWNKITDKKHQELQKALEKELEDFEAVMKELRGACDVKSSGVGKTAPSMPAEQQRLKFVNTITGAKNSLKTAEDELKKPISVGQMKKEDIVAAQRHLADKMAQLNAAIAALVTANSDRENPDYVKAEEAVRAISSLMPDVVKESKIACADKNENERAAMLDHIQALCDATQKIFASATHDQGLNNSASEFTEASNRLKFVFSPLTDEKKEKQIEDLSTLACGKASQLLVNVQQLVKAVGGETCKELDQKGAKTADAAQVLLTNTMLTASTIAEPHCQAAMISSIDALSSTGQDLKDSWRKISDKKHQELQKTLDKELEDFEAVLKELREACRVTPSGVDKTVPAMSKEQQRLKFVNTLSGAKNNLKAAKDELRKPVPVSQMKKEDIGAAQRRLADKMAQLNAAIAALVSANSDRENPDYSKADEAVRAISILMPDVVKECKLASADRNDKERADMLDHLQALCDATQNLCASATQDQVLYDPAAKFAESSNKLKFMFSPSSTGNEKQVLDLSSLACGKASHILANVQQLAEAVGGERGQELDLKGAKTADAAQTLLTNARLTASTISEPRCQEAMLSSIDSLSSSGQDLQDSWRKIGDKQHQDIKKALDEEVESFESVLKQLRAACQVQSRPSLPSKPAPPPPPSRKPAFTETQQTVTDKTPVHSTKPSIVTAKPKPPAPPKPGSHVKSKIIDVTQQFLDRTRFEESQDATRPRSSSVLSRPSAPSTSNTDDEKRIHQEFVNSVDNAKEKIKKAEVDLQKMFEAQSVSRSPLSANELLTKKQAMQDMLATVGVQVANLVNANYANNIDFSTASKATNAIPELMTSIVEEGKSVSSTMKDKERKAFLEDMLNLCESATALCDAANTDRKELNNAAIKFGDNSSKILNAVSTDLDPALEKEIIHRAKEIGDSASNIAKEAGNVAENQSAATTGRDVHKICEAGVKCLDAAGKLVYTAKLVSPSIHNPTCQEVLISSADTLSKHLKSFSNTWNPLSPDPHQAKSAQILARETANLEKLLEALRRDVRGGAIGKRREMQNLVIEDTPLRLLTMKIIDDAKYMAECPDVPFEKRAQYASYADRLADALRELDTANARCNRSPQDTNKRRDLENAIQDLQMVLLQTRPREDGKPVDYIVDLRDFIQEVSTEAKNMTSAAKGCKRSENSRHNKAIEDIILASSKIDEDAVKLMTGDEGGENSFDDVRQVDNFGQECKAKIKTINCAIQHVEDEKTKSMLQKKLLLLSEKCNLLMFATNSGLSTAQGISLDETLNDLDDLENRVIKSFVDDAAKLDSVPRRRPSPSLPPKPWVKSQLCTAVLNAAHRADAQPLLQAFTAYIADAATRAHLQDPAEKDNLLKHLYKVVHQLKELTVTTSKRLATWQPLQHPEVSKITEQILQELDNPENNFGVKDVKSHPSVLGAIDANKLLMPCDGVKVEGDAKELKEKVQQLCTKLTMTSSGVLQSVAKQESLARSLHATVECADQLRSYANALKAKQDGLQAKKIEGSTQEMSYATYNLLKTSEHVSRTPNNPDTRRKLLDALRQLNDSINKLVRATSPPNRVYQECEEQTRSLLLHQSTLQGPPQATCALPYSDCVDAIQSQSEVIQKLKSDQKMTKQEFVKNLNFISSAICNSTDYATQCAYLIYASEKDKEIANVGLVDVPKMQKLTSSIQDTCMSIIRSASVDYAEGDKSKLEKLVGDLIQSINESSDKIKDPELNAALEQCKKDLNITAIGVSRAFNDHHDKDKLTSSTMELLAAVNRTSGLIEDPSLCPQTVTTSTERKVWCDEVMNSSKALITKTQTLVKEVKSAPEPQDSDFTMTWYSFNVNRKQVLDAFDALLKSVQTNGQRAGIIEGSPEEAVEMEAPTKSYMQTQLDLTKKWLESPISKANAKVEGEQAAKNIIDIAEKMCEDIKAGENDDMRQVILETKQLLNDCKSKYDNEKYSVLLDRIKELKKGVERGVVTRVVEDFIEGDEPLADLDIIVDAERDETKRKYLLEKKIAELLAQLGRVTKTARFIADTGSGNHTLNKELMQCSEQTELLAPMLVKAAQDRVNNPDNKAIIDNYRSLLAKYAEQLSKVRDLCDQAVDPMDFVQTAGETMQRMREESSQQNDPMKCAQTSQNITKLANRVIHVSMSSRLAQSDPELQKALIEAKQRLRDTIPAPNTRASRLPDWRDTTAEILRTTGEVESVLGGENIFKKQPEPDQPIYSVALDLHTSIKDWSSRDNEIVAVAKRTAVLMARLSDYMNNDKKRELLATSKAIVTESHEVAYLAKKLAHECTDIRIKTNLLKACERIPTISSQLKMLTTVKGSSLGHQGSEEDKEAMNMLVHNAQSLMLSIQEVVKAAASASVKIMSQRGPRIKWVRKNYY